MNNMVHYKRKLQLLKKLDGEDLEKQCDRILNKFVSEKCEININKFDSYQDAVQYGFADNEFIVIGDDLYRIATKRYIPENNIFDVTDNNDGTFDYEVKYCDNYLNRIYGFNEIIRQSFYKYH